MRRIISIAAVSIIAFAGFLGLSFFEYSEYFINATTAGINQAIWKLSTHGVPIVTFGPYANQSLFSHHAEFIYFIISLFYPIYPHVLFLFAIQHIIVISGGISIYLLMREKHLSEKISLLLVLWYLAVYLWQQVVSGGIYSFDMAAVFLLWVIYAFEKKAIAVGVILGIMAIMTREESIIALLIISGSFSFIHKSRWYLISVVLALTYGCFLLFWFFPRNNGGYGNDFISVLSDSFTKKPLLSVNLLSQRKNEANRLSSFILALPQTTAIAADNTMLVHLSHRNSLSSISDATKAFFASSPCGYPSCPWLQFNGAPDYLLIDTSSVWKDTDLGMPPELFFGGVDTLIKAGYLHAYMKSGTITLYSINPVVLGDGLMASYYANRYLSGNASSFRVDPYINFHWTNQENFSVRWTGFLLPRYSEEYTFYVLRDDGVRLWVNNELLINRWFDHAATEYSIPIRLASGVKVPIKIEYYQHLGKAVLELGWSSPSTPKEIIPESQLFSH